MVSGTGTSSGIGTGAGDGSAAGGADWNGSVTGDTGTEARRRRRRRNQLEPGPEDRAETGPGVGWTGTRAGDWTEVNLKPPDYNRWVSGWSEKGWS